MSKEPELKARDKVVVRMTREGAVEENLTAGTEQRVSKRLEDAELVKPAETAVPSEALSAEEQKKVQMRRFQEQQSVNADSQQETEKPVREEKSPEAPPQTVQEMPFYADTPLKPLHFRCGNRGIRLRCFRSRLSGFGQYRVCIRIPYG